MARSLDLAKVRGDQAKEAGDFVQTQGRRNLIINGGFDVWQRGTSVSSTTGETYGADRWAVTSDRNTTHVQERNDFAVGQNLVEGNPTYFTRFNWLDTGEITRRELKQKVENVKQFSNRIMTLTFWAKATADVSGNLMHVFNYGGGSATDVLPLVPISYTTTWTKYEFKINCPDMSGKTIGDISTSHYGFSFRFDTTIGNDLFVAQVQLEAGDTATPFEQRSYGEELALCQRYHWRLDGSGVQAYIASGYCRRVERVILPYSFPVKMRTAPSSIEISALGDLSIVYNGFGAISPTSFVSDPTTEDATLLQLTNSTNPFTIGTGVVVAINTGGFISFDAEL